MTEDPNPLPQPVGTVNRLTPSPSNGQEGPQVAPGSTQTPPVGPQVIGTVEDALAWLACQFSCVVIAVSRKRVGQAPGTKPLAVSVLHAGEAQDALKLAGVAASVLQGA